MTDWYENNDARVAFAELSQRDRLATALLDENGLPPTGAALDVLQAVVRELDRTDERHSGGGVPSVAQYAIDAQRALRVLRKNQ